MYIYTDAHCHIKPIAKIPMGLAGRICNTTRPDEWSVVNDMRVDGINFLCIGIHPWYIGDVGLNWSEQMRTILRLNQTVMVGEIGLDKYKPDMERQLEVFIEQLNIASEFGRPVHLHCVGAWEKVLNIFKNSKMPPIVVAHAFNGAPDLIQMMSDKYNMYFSYCVMHNDERFPERIAATPMDRILIETDTFEPETEIEMLGQISDNIASVLGCGVNDVVEYTNQNFQRVASYVRSID